MASRWHVLLERIGQRQRLLLTPVVKSCRRNTASSSCPPTATIIRKFCYDRISPTYANQSGSSTQTRDRQVYRSTQLFGKLFKSGEDKKAAELLDGRTSCRSPVTVALGRALGRRKSGCAEDRLRTEENRRLILQRIHKFCKDSFASTGTRFHPLNGKDSSSILPYSVRGLSTQAALFARQKSVHDEESQSDLTRQEDPFDSITDKIPERPVSVAEGASYSVVILLGLAIAGAAAYAVFKELVFEPKEYKVFGKALNRVQSDNQVSVRLGSPITGYGQESRNRAARQRISNRAWTDEAGVERVEVMFHIRGPAGAGKVYSEMFKDPEDKTWKYTYLIVDVTSPTPTRLMLESYVPPVAPLNAL